MQEAVKAGASRTASCELLNLDLRRLQRWEHNPENSDGRCGPKTQVSHKLTEAEKTEMLVISNSEKFRDFSPWHIVAKLADEGKYVASESSFYRLFRERNLLAHRTKSNPRTHTKPWELLAEKPNEIWSWDITYLKSPVKGIYYYLYMIEDIFSRMIISWRVEEVESSVHAANLIQAACNDYQIIEGQVTLHSDNGGPMKGATMLAKLQSLGVFPSFSRPSVSDDNPFSESLFKTLKYRPSYPDGAFANIEEARQWVSRFVSWYNTEHLHSGIKFVTPISRHQEIALASRPHGSETCKKQSTETKRTGPILPAAACKKKENAFTRQQNKKIHYAGVNKSEIGTE